MVTIHTFKRLVKETIAFFLLCTNILRKQEDDKILSIYFHNPDKKRFERICRWLKRKGYTVISIKQLESIISEKRETRKLAIITFDDGWNKNLELLESIEQNQIPVTIFVTTESVEQGNYWWEYAEIKGQERLTAIQKIQDFKKLPVGEFREKLSILKQQYTLNRSAITLDELKVLSRNKYVTIGSHTVTHPILTQCPEEVQKVELTESKKQLLKFFNKDIDFISYPNGNYNLDTLNIVKNTGYKLGFTVEPERIDVKKVNPFLIPRYSIDDNGGYFENLSKILGIWQKYHFER